MEELRSELFNYSDKSSFIGWLMLQQYLFETGIVGTDGTLYEHNTLEIGLTRGVIGEAEEAMSDLMELLTQEKLRPNDAELLLELKERLNNEIVDILVFIGSVLLHSGMSPDEIVSKINQVFKNNKTKYDKRNFEGRTIKGGVEYSRLKYAGRLPEQDIERRRNNGHPMPSNYTEFRKSEEWDYSTASAGSIT